MHPSAMLLSTRKKRESDKAYSIIQKMSFVFRRLCIVYVVPNFRGKTVTIFDVANTSEAERFSNSRHPDSHFDPHETSHIG
jgi:hypothetical protein